MSDPVVNEGTDLAAKPAIAPAAAAAPVPVETTDDDVDAKWKSVLIVAAGSIPSGEKRAVIVCEVRGDDGALKDVSYPKGADLYYGYVGDEEAGDHADFADNSPVIRVGAEVQQGHFWGLSKTKGVVHVGPGSPAYGALNVATLRGATDVEIRGLTKAQKDQLAPWIARIPTDPLMPSDVKVTLS